MPKFPLWLRSLFFLAVIAFLFSALQSIFTETFNSQVYVLEQMIEENDTLDIVILGSSHAYCAFDPTIIDTLLADTETVNLSIPNISTAHSALLVKQMIEQGKIPQVVVLEMYSLTSIMENTVQVSFFNDYSKTWQPEYLQWIVGYYEPDQLMAPLLPLIHQHENWKKPGMLTTNIDPFTDKQAVIERAVKMTMGYDTDGFRGFPMLITTADYNHSLVNSTPFQPQKANLRGLQQILALSKTYGFKVLLVQAPFPKGFNSDFTEMESVTNEYGLTPYLLNQTNAEDYIPLDFLDSAHLNAHGAIPASITLAEILSAELDRPLDETRIAAYREVRLADIDIQNNGTQITITLIPDSLTADWQVEWAIKSQEQILQEHSGKELTFTFPADLLDTKKPFLYFTITQEGFEYPVTLRLAPEIF